MPKRMYIGIDSVARSVRKAYIGVDSMAKRIKKAYIGIGGVARPFYTLGGIDIYGRVTSLNAIRHSLAGASVGNHALFAGGINYSTFTSKVDAYDSSLVCSAQSPLSVARCALAGTNVGDYALFAGGYNKATNKSESNASNVIDAYSGSLVVSSAPAMGDSIAHLAACSHGDYAFFAGGCNYRAGSVNKYVYSYNTSLTRSYETSLNVARHSLAVATVGDYAIFAGGESTHTATSPSIIFNHDVDAYNKSKTHSIPAVLSAARSRHAGASTSSYAIFAGGCNGSSNASLNYFDYAEAYDSNLTRTTIPLTIQFNSVCLSASSLGNCAVFFDTSGCYVFNDSLTLSFYDKLYSNSSGAAAVVGNYCIVAGGSNQLPYGYYLGDSAVSVSGLAIAYALANIPE